MNVADELEKLQQLHQSGGISDDEFAKAKAKLLTAPTSGLDSLFGSSGNVEQQTRQWAMFLHLSQLLHASRPVWRSDRSHRDLADAKTETAGNR